MWCLLLLGCAAPAPYPAAEGRHPAGCRLPDGQPSAIVLAVHGLNDHRGAFDALATHLGRAGVAVCSYDQRGFGAAPGRGAWPGVAPLAEDLRRWTWELRRRHPGIPLYVLGESMGAAVALVAFSGAPVGPDGLVLSAPAVLSRETIGPIRSWLVQALARLLPDLALTRPAAVTVTDDPAVRHQLARDPLLIGRTRLEVLAGVLSLMDAAAQSAQHVHVPTLLLYGRRDPVIPPETVQRLAGALPGPVQHYAQDGYHLLLRGRAAAVSAQRILAWLAQQPGSRFAPAATTAPNAQSVAPPGRPKIPPSARDARPPRANP